MLVPWLSITSTLKSHVLLSKFPQKKKESPRPVMYASWLAKGALVRCQLQVLSVPLLMGSLFEFESMCIVIFGHRNITTRQTWIEMLQGKIQALSSVF